MTSVLLAVFLTVTAGCGSSGQRESAKPATEILHDAANALRSVQSYRIDGMLDPGFTVHIVVVKGGSTGTTTAHGVTWSSIAIQDTLWLRGKDLWTKTLSRADAARLGDSWVLVTNNKAAFGYARALKHLDQTIPGLVFARRTLENKGEQVIGGQKVIRLENDDDIYDIRASGTPFPLSWLEKENPGPDGKPCGITLSGFDAPATVTPPVTDKVLP